MSDEIIEIPDIGGGQAEVIEICVNSGDLVAAEDSLIVLESDKATMDVPAPRAGIVTEVLLKVGDNVSAGSHMVKMKAEDSAFEQSVSQSVPLSGQPSSLTPDPMEASTVAASPRLETVIVPDMGANNVPVIELCVNVGDVIAKEDSVIVLESDKATMEIPSTAAGMVKAIHVNNGDILNQGDRIIDVEISSEAGITSTTVPAQPASVPGGSATQLKTRVENIKVPDIGAENVPVIEVCVSEGDQIEEESPLVVLESDKATMEVPSPFAGVVRAVTVNVGDILNQGDSILDVEIAGHSVGDTAVSVEVASGNPLSTPAQPRNEAVNPVNLEKRNQTFHAGPAVRKLAREFGVDLSVVKGSGPRDRILKEDLQLYVKSSLSSGMGTATTTIAGQGIPQMPEVDFGRWGQVEEVSRGRLFKVAAQNFQRSWLNVPHVTQFDECDITDLEAFRKEQKPLAEARGTRLTPLPFIIKAVAGVLRELPQFCASLSSDGEKLIYKKYINIGIAVDTPGGLLVPVIKNVNKKSLWDLSVECIELAGKARDKKLKPDEMQGGCFTISSLGSIGGTAFTPIVNAPEVAILGLSKSCIKPVWNGKEFKPGLMLPLSLSYDHRAINGADAARFTSMLGSFLSDIRRLLL